MILEFKTQLNLILTQNLSLSILNIMRLMRTLSIYLNKRRETLIHEIDQQKQEQMKAQCMAYGKFYKQFKFVGMTATLALLFKEAIENSGCRYMMIEEVGELNEATTIGIIPNTIEHLAMIGDYNQLRPKVEYELINEKCKKASYDISTFERLVRAQIKSGNPSDIFTLTLQ